MFGKLLKIAGNIAAVIPIVKDIWYAVKKNVPRVTCPNCKGAGVVIVGAAVLDKPAHTETCPICKGAGKIRETEVPKGVTP
jgi:RecJ-like exonuclease